MSRHTTDVILLALVVFIIGHLTIISASAEPGSTRAYCASEWPNDYQMQEHCIDSELDALRGFVALVQSRGFMDKAHAWTQAIRDHALHVPIARCVNKWEVPEFETQNWRMLEHCVKGQIASYERIHGKIIKETTATDKKE